MSGAITLRRVDPDADLDLLHGWMQQPHVVPWWLLEGPRSRLQSYLATQLALPYLTPWIASVGDEPFAYVETYRAAEDPLAAQYDAEPDDRGWHLLVGPPERLGTGDARRLGETVLRRLFANPATERVVCEPDVRNTRMHRFCARLGFATAAEIELPGKRALLMICTRDAYRRAVTWAP